jgi:hypothetical protein
MNDHPFLVIGLVTVLATCSWIVLFWKVPLPEWRKNILLGHLLVADFFLTVSGMINYLLEVPMEIRQLVITVIGCAPAVGGYLQFGRRKS